MARQLEGTKPFGNVGIFKGLSLNAIFRVSYDAVYELNDTDYGDKAGGPILLENEASKVGVGPALVPHGGGRDDQRLRAVLDSAHQPFRV